MHQLGVVQRPLRVEHVQVFGEEAGEGCPVAAGLTDRDPLEIGRLQADLTSAREKCAHLLGEAAGRQALPQDGRP